VPDGTTRRAWIASLRDLCAAAVAVAPDATHLQEFVTDAEAWLAAHPA
jgi:hypothetical protein